MELQMDYSCKRNVLNFSKDNTGVVLSSFFEDLGRFRDTLKIFQASQWGLGNLA